jgi:hypothetical protein
VKPGKYTVSAAAQAAHLTDVALAARFDELLAAARDAEQAYRQAQASGLPGAEIGPRGYEDRIYRRKAMAKPAVHALTEEAERLLTLREAYQLTGFPARPEASALGVEVARRPAAASH